MTITTEARLDYVRSCATNATFKDKRDLLEFAIGNEYKATWKHLNTAAANGYNFPFAVDAARAARFVEIRKKWAHAVDIMSQFAYGSKEEQEAQEWVNELTDESNRMNHELTVEHLWTKYVSSDLGGTV